MPEDKNKFWEKVKNTEPKKLPTFAEGNITGLP